MATGNLNNKRNPQVTFTVTTKHEYTTNMGSFTVEIFLDQMPVTGANFIDLAASGFYTGLHFHRTVMGFMVQLGCPHSRDCNSREQGTGSPPPGSSFISAKGVIVRNQDGGIPDEFPDCPQISNERMTLSMANTRKPNTCGSQFFINTVHNERLDFWRSDLGENKNPVFGRVVAGRDVVLKISRVHTGDGDAPRHPIQCSEVSVEW